MRSRRFLSLLLGGAIALECAGAGADLDPLTRPAVISARATHSVLLSVASAGKRLIAVGERGYILLSDDSGDSWRQANSPVSVTLTAVRFADAKQGIAVGHGGVALRSEDGGETWSKQLDGRQAAQMLLDAAKTMAGSPRQNAKARSLQLKLAQQLIDDGPDKPFFDACSIDQATYFIVGPFNMIFRSNDAGKSWQPWSQRVPNAAAAHLHAIHCRGREILIAGEQGVLFRSEDGGFTFSALTSPFKGSFFNIVVSASGEIAVFGLRGNAFLSSDHGASWTKIETGTAAGLTAGTVLKDGRLVLVSQNGEVLVSRANWSKLVALPVPVAFPFTGVWERPDRSLQLIGVRGLARIAAPPAAQGGK